MKRLRIWLSNFSLIQQFLSIVFLTTSILVFFVLTYLNKNIDTFVNSQMYVYIHRSQNEYIDTRVDDDNNIVHFVYSASSGRYLNKIPDEYEDMLKMIDPDIVETSYDGSFIYGNLSIVYSITTFDEDFKLVSIAENDFRDEFKTALSNGVINVTFYVVMGLIALIMLWVMSLIRPLNMIISYINKVKTGDKATLAVNRYDEIGEVAEALTSMNDELSRQQQIRDEMIQNISHDLKTPIATIKSYSESIKDGIYPYDTLEKSVDVIGENADRLEKKVYSLITYNKLGYLTDDGEEILNLDMAPIVRKALLDCKVLRNDIKIIANIDEDVFFHGEEEPWRVVVENLLDNALRYAKTRVELSLEKNLLEVFNDGEAIEAERLDKLFKPYEKGTKGKFGLGLSIIKKVCDTYGYVATGENMADGVVFRVYTDKKMKRPTKKKSTKKGIIES